MAGPPRWFKRTKKASKKSNKTKVPKAVKQYVNRKLDEAIEDKFVQYNLDDDMGVGTQGLVLTPSSSTYPLGYKLNTPLSQGTGSNQRVGDMVKLKKVLLKLQLILNGAAQTGTVDVPMCIRMIIAERIDGANSLPTFTDMNNLFKYNAGTNTPFLSGSGLALLNRPNRELWKVYKDKVYKLGYATSTLNNGQFTNNDYKMQINDTIDCTRFYNKRVKYSGSTPTENTPSPWVFFFVQKANLDVTIANWDAPSALAVLQVDYEDA